MLKNSHIKINPINFVLLLIFSLLLGCYMPGGGFILNDEDKVIVAGDSIFVSLSIERQVYNYFKVSYVKKNAVFPAEKINDSTIVFISNTIKLHEKIIPFRVEYGILPFFEKRKEKM